MDAARSETSTGACDPWERAQELGALVRRLDDPGPGRPLVVKEILGIRGVPRTASSGADLAPVAAEDSGPVAPLRAAGWVPVAVSRTHEHAWGITTRTDDRRGTLNPHDASRIPGGSSGGSAVAVAVGLCDVALGSDTAGSIRIPAAFCGVLGIKPTWGAVDMTGCQALAPSLDTPGLLCSDADSAVAAMRAWGLPTTHAGGLRWGVAVDSGLPAVRPDLAQVLDAAVRGAASPQEVRLPAQELLEVFRGVQPREALAVHRDVLGTWPARQGSYGPGVASRLRAAERLPPDATLVQRRARARAALLTAMADLDVLALPVAACGPTSVDDPDVVAVGGRAVPLRDLVLPFTVPASLCGLPAASVPVGVDRDGLPVGLQLVAHPHGEGALVEAVRAVLAWVDARR